MNLNAFTHKVLSTKLETLNWGKEPWYASFFIYIFFIFLLSFWEPPGLQYLLDDSRRKAKRKYLFHRFIQYSKEYNSM
jgi:hypothetical protein